MSEQSHPWYVRGAAGQPAGPFSTEQVLESCRAGRLDADSICWHEGLAQWLALGEVEPFATVVASASVSLAAAGATAPSAALVGAPSVAARGQPGHRRPTSTAWIVWAATGGAVALCAMVAGVVLLWPRNELKEPPRSENPPLQSAGQHSDAGREGPDAAALTKIIQDYAARLRAAYQAQSTEIQREATVASAVAELKARVAKCGTVALTGKVVEIIQEPSMLGGGTRDRWGISMDLPPEFEPLVRDGACTFGSKVWVDLERSKALSIHKGDPITVRGTVSYIQGGLLLSGDNCVAIQVWPNSKDSVTKGFGLGNLGTPHTLVVPVSDSVACSVGPFASLGVCHFLGGPARSSGTGPLPAQSAEARVSGLGGANFGSPPKKKRPEQQKEEKERYEKSVAQAAQAVEQGQWQEAENTVLAASRRFPDLYENRARKILNDARFGLALDRAKTSLGAGDLDAAMTAVDAALRIRFADQEAKDLRGKICRLQVAKLEVQSRTASNAGDFAGAVRFLQQAAELLPDDAGLRDKLDTASMELHRSKAENALAADNLSQAGTELLAARDILARHATDQSASLRKALDALAEKVAAESRKKAKARADLRQYDDARRAVRLGLRLSAKDQDLADLLKEIEKLAADPKTANLSGKWAWPDGECRLTDNGTETIGYKALKLPKGIRSCTGGWTRKGDKLVGKFRVVLARSPGTDNEGTVTATVKDAKTLAVFWQDVYPRNLPKKGPWIWHGTGELSWTKADGAD